MRIIYGSLMLQIAGSKVDLTGRLTASQRISELRGSVSVRPGGAA